MNEIVFVDAHKNTPIQIHTYTQLGLLTIV